VRGLLRLSGGDCSCEAHDLSRSGVLLTGDLPTLAPDQRSDLTLTAPAGGLEFRTNVRVVRYTAAEGGAEARAAVEFVGLSADQREKLEALIARVIEGLTPAPLASLKPGAPTVEVRKALDAIPLAHRVALAIRASAHEREFLRQDTNPAVLEALARNASLHSAEAQVIAASPHVLPTTLEILLADARWARDEEIRRLVAIHPRTPLALAERAIASLKPLELRKILQASSLSQALRERIMRRLSHGH